MSLSGDECDGWAPACPDCRDPLDEDGSCFYCGTVACHGCGEVIKHADAVVIEDGGQKIPLCPTCGAPEDETVQETTLTDAQMLALLEVS
jgi:hypothetical protein